MRFVTIEAVVFSVLSLGCREAWNPIAPASPAESPDYAVYDAVLDGLFGNETSGQPLPRYVLSDSTMIGPVLDENNVRTFLQRQFGPLLTPLFDATSAEYTSQSSIRVPLDARAFHPHGAIELVSRGTLDALTATGAPNPSAYWHAFYGRYPGSKGHIQFSRPGYDASGTHALLAYAHLCGGLCGDWGFVLLERRGDRWVILRRILTGVA
jgi:hypothetical protein